MYWSGLESRLRYAQSDRENTARQIESTKKEIVKLENKLENVAPDKKRIKDDMQSRDIKIQEIKERMNSVEDNVFADFCAQIGVANIRQYEERELRSVLHLALLIVESGSGFPSIAISMQLVVPEDSCRHRRGWIIAMSTVPL